MSANIEKLKKQVLLYYFSYAKNKHYNLLIETTAELIYLRIVDLIIKALLAGLGISILVGPIFFGLIQLSIERGAKAGVIFSSGIWASDLLFVFVVQKGLGFIGNNNNFILSFGIIGSLILMGFGVGIFMSPMKREQHVEISAKNALGYFLKGVSINVFNPFVILLWVSILSVINNEPLTVQWTFVGIMLSVVALFDVLKALFASRIMSQLGDSKLRLFKNSAGIILGGFGVALLVRTLVKIL